MLKIIFIGWTDYEKVAVRQGQIHVGCDENALINQYLEKQIYGKTIYTQSEVDI